MQNLDDAKALAAEIKQRGADARSLVPYVLKKIEQAIRDGDTHVVDPLKGIRTPVTNQKAEETYLELEKRKFIVVNNTTAGHVTISGW